MRPLRALIALLLATFALAGCMKIEMDLKVNGDSDTLSGSMVFAIKKSVLDLSGKPHAEAFGDASENIDDLPKGSRVEVYQDEVFYGQKIIFEDVPFAEFNQSDPTSPHLVHEDGLYTFTMDATVSEDDLGPDAEALKGVLDEFELNVTITFPGRVIERDNLAQLNGNTVSWKLKMSSNHKLKVVAEEPSKFQWVLAASVGGIFGVLVVAGIIILALRSRRRRQSAGAPITTDATVVDPFAAPPALPASPSDPDARP